MPAPAPNGLTFNSDALPRRPQPMPSTHTLSFFFRARVSGVTGPRRRRGNLMPPFHWNMEGVYPQNLLNLPYTPLDCKCLPLVRTQYPRMTHYDAFKKPVYQAKSQYSKLDCTSPPNGSNRPRAEPSVVVVVVVVVVLTLTRIIKSEVTGQAPVTLELSSGE